MLDRKGQAILLTMVFVGVTLGIAVGSYQQEPATELAVFPDDAVTLAAGVIFETAEDDRYIIGEKDSECVKRVRQANALFLGLPCDAMGDCCTTREDCYREEWCPYVTFTFYVDVEVTMNDEGHVVVEVVREGEAE